MIKCCFCNRTIEPTDKCRRLFDMYICPECSEKLARVTERVLIDKIMKNEKCETVTKEET